MSREYPARPFVGLVALVRREGRFLLVRRGREPNRGRWGFPGGVQELGETIVAGVLRELGEETGIVADAPSVLTALDVIDHDAAGRVRHHYTLVAVRLAWRGGEGEAGDDADALGWFAPDALDGLDLLPSVRELMDLAAEGAEAGRERT